MPLRLVNKQRVHPITICDTVFNIISMTIGEKEQLVHDLQNIDVQVGAFARLLDIISPAIANVKGYEQSTRKVLEQLEDIEQLREIVRAIIQHCSLTKEEVKNSSSSSGQPIPVSAGNAENVAAPEGVPVSTTQTNQDSSSLKDKE